MTQTHTGSKRFRTVSILTAVCYFGLYGIIALTLLLYQPFGNPPDEYNRYLIPRFIAENGTLPTGFEEEVRIEGYGSSYAFHPILPYIFQGYLMRLVGMFTQDAGALLFTARLVNFFFGLVMAVFVLLLGRKWFQDKRFAWLFAFLVTFWPQGLFLHTYVNTDSCCMMSIAIMLYGLTLGLQTGFDKAACIWLSLGIILCALSYYNAYGFILSCILLFAASYLSRENGRLVFRWKTFLKTGCLVSLFVLLGIGWWFLRNLLLYDGDLLGMAARERFAALHALPRYQPALRPSWLNLGYSVWDMLRDTDFVTLTRQSFICSYGAMNITTSIWIYRFYRVLVAGGILCSLLIPIGWTRDAAGILDTQAKTPSGPGIRMRKGLTRFFHGNMAFCIAMPYLLSVIFSYTTDYQPQGRYVLPALVPLCYYVVHGLEKLLLLEPGKLPGFLGRAGRQWAGKHTVPAGSRKKEGIPTAVVITLSALVAFFLLWTVWGYALPYYAANPVAP